MRRLGVRVLAVFLALIALACSGDDDDKSDEAGALATPEFIVETRSAPTGAVATPVIVSSGPGATSLRVAPVEPPGVAGAGRATLAPSAGVTVRHTESATVPADRAFVVAQLQVAPGPGPFSPGISGRQQEQITTALTAIGVAKDDINFETVASYGPFPSVSVPVPLNELQTRGRRIIEAMETAVGTRTQSGARFALSDCRTALEPLRKQAIEAANDQAKSLAAASSLTLGSLQAITQTSNQASPGGPPSDPCSATAGGGPKAPGNLQALDAEPRVQLNLLIEATYAIGNSRVEGGLTATGTGRATAKADEAYIVVTVYNQSPGPFGPQPIAKKTRDDLIARLKALQLDEDEIQIEGGFTGGPGQTIVSVEAPLNGLPKTGRDVVSAVEDVLGRSQTQGVWFSHSNCAAVLEEARKQAVADAKRSADALANSASLRLGSLTAITEGPPSGAPQSPYATATTNPCTDNVAALFQGGGGPFSGVALKTFDATPEFTVNSNVTVTYAIQP